MLALGFATSLAIILLTYQYDKFPWPSLNSAFSDKQGVNNSVKENVAASTVNWVQIKSFLPA